MQADQLLLAFGLTLFAGLSTGIGGVLSLFWKKTNTKLLSIVLGFSAGVMIYVSMIEIFTDARKHITDVLGNKAGSWLTVGAFFAGIFLIALIDRLIPSYENPHESHRVEEMGECSLETKNSRLLHTSVMTALAIAIHNFPEGLAAFTSVIQNPPVGIAIAIAIAIHNIPEGIAVSIPVYCATGSRKKALLISLLSGFSEPVGAVVGYLILMPFLDEVVFGVLFAAIAGIMIFISLDELLPTAQKYGEHHLSIFGLVGGMMVMAVSLLLLI